MRQTDGADADAENVDTLNGHEIQKCAAAEYRAEVKTPANFTWAEQNCFKKIDFVLLLTHNQGRWRTGDMAAEMTTAWLKYCHS